MSKHIAVLMGGWSVEREISLLSGKACADALTRLGYKVTSVDAGRDLAQVLDDVKPDLIFNALHGRWGEDGCVQGLLEVAGMPYTHSGVLASALAMDKPLAKVVMAAAGLAVPKGVSLSPKQALNADPLARPYVLKAPNEGSSVSVLIVDDQTALQVKDWVDYDVLLAEEYIPGRELSVAVLNDEALGVIELRPKSGFYDYKGKYTDGMTDHLMPAPLHEEAYAQAMDMAVRAHKALGCKGVSRVDFRYDDTAGAPGRLVILEVNTQPGMTPLSLVPEMAAHRGIGFDDLVQKIVEAA